MIARCGVGDGEKVCGRPIQHLREVGPYRDPKRRFVVGMCRKHAQVAVDQRAFARAEATEQNAVHLVRVGEMATLFDDLADDLAEVLREDLQEALRDDLARRSPE